MEAFLHFNCFRLIAFLYLIITSELPPAADCIQNESLLPLTTNVAASTNTNTNFFHYFRGLHSSLSDNRNYQFHTSSLSSLPTSPFRVASPFIPLSASTDTLSTKFVESILLHDRLRNEKRKENQNSNSSNIRNTNRHNILLHNLTNNKKNPSSPHLSSTYLSARSSYLDKQENDDNGVSVSKSNHRSSSNTNAISKDHYGQLEKTTMTFGWRGGSGSSRKSKRVLVPPEKSSPPPLTFPVEQRQKEKVGKAAAVGPFPVAYLMNSYYELESPSISTKPLDTDGDNSSSKITLRRSIRSSSSKSIEPQRSTRSSGSVLGGNDEENADPSVVPNIEYLAMPLRSNDDVGEGNDNSEISTDSTTLTPEAVALSDVTEFTSLPKDSETTSPTDDTGGISETTDEEKSMLNNQTAGTTPLRGKCNETLQCMGEHVECRLGICKCQLGYLPRVDNGELCGEASAHHVEVPTTDPTMIGVVVGLALMSVTLCVVLRLFAKARFRENRTIFNTPNPRLMNVSLLKGSKTLLRGNSAGGAGQRSRRGSQVSMNSGQIEGQSPVNTTPDGNGASGNAAAGSSHPHRMKPSRTLSTDTTNLEGTPTSSRPMASGNRSKFRQDSVASNV